MTAHPGYVIEETPDGRMVVVTGAWSDEVEGVLLRGEVDGLVLNYARGFNEGNLEFLSDHWGLRQLDILDRGITDLEPISRVGSSLEMLSVQAAPPAELDLQMLPHLRSVSGEWKLLCGTLSDLNELQSVITWRFDETDLHAFRDHVALERLTIKEAPYLESLSGLGDLVNLTALGIFLARRLNDVSEVSGLVSLEQLEFEDCPSLDTIDDIEPLIDLRILGISQCGDLKSAAPIGSLAQLEVLYAWGSTHVLDGDLSPLALLPKLKEIRMRDRRGYRPSVADLVSALPTH
jgi:hypothetical protein